MSNKHLYFTDPHAHPDYDNDRFELLGKMIVAEQPDVVVCGGDFGDMPSLCSYDRGRKDFEGRRYKNDVKSVIDAQRRLFAPIDEYNEMKRRNGKKMYRPHYVMCGGNHDEGRIVRAFELQPEMDGLISVDDFKFEEFGWQYVPFLDKVEIDGIVYSHYLKVRGANKVAVGGKYPASAILDKGFRSMTVGHSHVRDFCERATVAGNKIMGLVGGCFFDYEMDYAGADQDSWWRGVVIKHDVQDGVYDPEFVSMSRMEAKYG